MAEAILGLVTAVLTLAGLLVTKTVKTRVAPQQLSAAYQFARTSVEAAEKVGRALGLEGPEKYGYAEQALLTLARRVGLRLKPEEANAFIHAVLNEADVVAEQLEEYAEETTPAA